MALRTVSNGRKEYADGKASVRQWSFRRRRGRGGGRVVSGLGTAGLVGDHRAPSHRIRQRHHPAHRSEEHTSELQSLMRISYAVFCLKKKKKKKPTSNHIHTDQSSHNLNTKT